MIKGLTIMLTFTLVYALSAQEKSKSADATERFIEFFTLHPNKKAVAQDSTLYSAKIILAPIISYKPSTSLGLGVGSKLLFKIKGSGDETRTSNMPISFQYTLNNQFILYSGFEIFSPQEKWMLTGNIGLQNFPGVYYGLGRDTPKSNKEEYEYNQILFEPILLKGTGIKHLFVGGGARFNRISSVEAEKENSLLENTNVPGALGSTSVGLEIASVFDSRDNLLNAYSGWYLEFTHGFYDESFGSTQNFQLTRLDARYFFQPFKVRKDVIAFQIKTHFAHSGTPLQELAFFGGQEIMRGYFKGRYVQSNMIAGQVEYRATIKGRFGAVAFVGAGDVANNVEDFTFKNLRPSVGFGLRFLLDERERLNVRFDWGFGSDTNNYYLNVAEAF